MLTMTRSTEWNSNTPRPRWGMRQLPGTKPHKKAIHFQKFRCIPTNARICKQKPGIYLRISTGSRPKSSSKRACGGNCYSLKRITIAYFTIQYLLKAPFSWVGGFYAFLCPTSPAKLSYFNPCSRIGNDYLGENVGFFP